MMRGLFPLVLILVWGTSWGFAQANVAELEQRAQQAFAAKDWPTAVVHLRALVKADPKHAIGWSRLGYALHTQGKLNEAMVAHERAAAFEETRDLACYNIGCIHALAGRADEAFAWLDKAVAAGFWRVEHVAADADLKALREDARFAKLLGAMRAARKASQRNVAIFVHDGVELLDFAGPGEVFSLAGTPRGPSFNVYTVAQSTDAIRSQRFLSVVPQYTFANCPPPDVVVLPGGSTGRALKTTEVVAWVKKVAPDAKIILSVCTGAFILADAGLLDGLEATTHFSALNGLANRAKKATIRRDLRVVDNGKVITTAGISAGIDGALSVVERLLGEKAALRVAAGMEYRWTRDHFRGHRPRPQTAQAKPRSADARQ